MKTLLFSLSILFFTTFSIFGQTQPLDTDGNGYYNISTLDELRWISENENARSWDFELDNDIDAYETRNWYIGDHDNDSETPDSAMGWKPIGRYSGKFNGNGYSISNLYINRPEETVVGFFANLYDGKVSYFSLSNCDITGQDFVGGIAGITGNSSGDYEDPTVLTYISCSWVSGSIKGVFDVGGLVGAIGGTSDHIYNSYSHANVEGRAHVAGFVGECVGFIENCYSTGTVKGIDEYSEPQGFVGTTVFFGMVETGGIGKFASDAEFWWESYWDTELSGLTTSVGGGTALTTAEMKTKSSFGWWDFEKIWDIDGTTNNGYPFLRKQTASVEDSDYPEEAIVIYPNPASDMVRIRLKQAIVDFTSIMIYDASGNVVYSGSAGDVDISVFPAGLYFVVDSSYHRTGKFLKR
jgi:hypothetical protein